MSIVDSLNQLSRLAVTGYSLLLDAIHRLYQAIVDIIALMS